MHSGSEGSDSLRKVLDVVKTTENCHFKKEQKVALKML